MKNLLIIKNKHTIWPALLLGLTLFNPVLHPPFIPGVSTEITKDETPHLLFIEKKNAIQTNDRPLLSITTYAAEPLYPKLGQVFQLNVTFSNLGSLPAQYVTIDFPSGDFVPLDTGGMVFVQEILPTETGSTTQSFLVPANITVGLRTIDAVLKYTDPNGISYTDTFTFAISVYQPPPTNIPSYFSVASPTPSGSPQLLIGGFSIADIHGQPLGSDQYLEPGSFFSLNLNLINIGKGKASNILMVLGGATSSGTGLSGAVGNFSIFSPVNASNFVSIGNIEAGDAIQFSQPLVVNNAANSGSYNLQISFVYNNPKGDKIIDDQIVSLQVLVQPKVQPGLYSPINTALVDQPVSIPLMLTNLSSETVQLGELDISCNGWDIYPQSAYIGKIDSGEQWFPPGEFIGTPHQAGQTECQVNIHYLDDFGKPRLVPPTKLILSAEQTTFIPDNQISLEGTPTNISTLPEDKPKNNGINWGIFKQMLLGFLGLDSSTSNDSGITVLPDFSSPTPTPFMPAKKP